VVVGDFSTPLSPIDRTPRQKNNEESSELNDTIDQMDIYRIFHLATAQYSSQKPMGLSPN
jgi:hypothetical protein